MLEAVTAVCIYQDEIFIIRRQPHLRVFPGFHAFPGGKVDKEDAEFDFEHPLLPVEVQSSELGALFRELQEELNWDMAKALGQGHISSITKFGTAVTPSVYPVRFNTHYFRIDLTERIQFEVDVGEIAWSEWMHRHALRSLYKEGNAVMVLPTRYTVFTLADNIAAQEINPFTLVYEPTKELPYLEMISDIGLIPVPSNTLPPATSTNAIHFGDRDSGRFLVDPSPKDEETCERLLATLLQHPVDKILISHHHPDHHEFAPVIARKLKLPVFCTEQTLENIHSKFGQDYFSGVEINFIEEGDCVTRWLGKDVLVHELTGHDNGMVGLAPEDMSWLFVADLVEPGTTVVIPEDVGDMQDYFHSLERVLEKAPKAIIPSHGLPMGGTNLIKQTLKHRKLREAQIRTLLLDGEDEDDMVHLLYDEIHPKLIPLARQNIRQHIVKIKRESSL